MFATKWHKRAAERFKVEPHAAPRKLLPEGKSALPGNFVPGVRIGLSGPVGSDDVSWLDIDMTVDEARDLANRLQTMAKIAEENG